MEVIINPKEIKGLAKCSGFYFEINVKTDRGEWHLDGSQDQNEQMALIRAIQVSLGRLNNYPCEAQLEFGAKNGAGFIKGEVFPCLKEAVVPVRQILTESCFALCVFGRSYPQSEFSITITQEVTIPEIRYEDPIIFVPPFI